MTKFISLTKSAGLKSQVISLGAGFDTTYWRLCSVGLQPTSYIEVDLATVTSGKCHCIRYASGSLVGLAQLFMSGKDISIFASSWPGIFNIFNDVLVSLDIYHCLLCSIPCVL